MCLSKLLCHIVNEKSIIPALNRNKCKRKYNAISLNSSNILLFVPDSNLENFLPFCYC